MEHHAEGISTGDPVLATGPGFLELATWNSISQRSYIKTLSKKVTVLFLRILLRLKAANLIPRSNDAMTTSHHTESGEPLGSARPWPPNSAASPDFSERQISLNANPAACDGAFGPNM